MNAKTILDEALSVMGLTTSDGTPLTARDGDFLRRGLSVINRIYSELSTIEKGCVAPPLADLSEEPELSLQGIEAMILGTAMILAQAEADREGEAFFRQLYRERRGMLFSARSRKDVLPLCPEG